MKASPRTKANAIRVSAETLSQLDEAAKLTPYKITKTSIIERGVVLALREVKEMFQKGEQFRKEPK